MTKKNIFKIFFTAVTFIIVFCLLFMYAQNVFIVKHYDTITFAQFYNEPENSLDVLFFGSSSVRASAVPAVLWEHSGITSYNLAGSLTPSFTAYYMLTEALRYQSPQAVVLGAELLLMQEDFDEQTEARNQRAFDYMPFSANKVRMLIEFAGNMDRQSYVTYLFPFFYYHNRRDLSERDFNLSFLRQRSMHMGTQRKIDITYQPVGRPPEFNDPYHNTDFYLNEEYFTKIIRLCKRNDIAVLLYMPPICIEDRWSVSMHNALREYADRHGIDLLDFNTSALHDAAGIDESADYYNEGHVNMSGATKVSRYLAAYLSDNLGLPDRRDSGYDKHWDTVAENYYEQYNILLERIEQKVYRWKVDTTDADND